MMSKENVFEFLIQAAKDKTLKTKVKNASSQDELVGVAEKSGYEFSAEHVDEALGELKRQPGFFGMLAEAALAIFSPHDDDYPATGMQPFSGDRDPKR
ncbi:MAG: Nif11-like leader peptide family natural product precursor [Phormidesmis sp.]